MALTADVSSQPTSLAIAANPSLATRPRWQSDSAYIKDGYLWSVSAGEDGSFHFYAVPRNNAATLGFSQWQDRMPAPSSTASWETMQTRSAAAQYAFCASISSPAYGHFLDVYA